MTNRDKIQKALGEEKIGCYDKRINDLTAANLKKVIDALSYGSDTDVDVCINRKRYVVEIQRDGLDEVDFYIMTKTEYINRYGNERYE